MTTQVEFNISHIDNPHYSLLRDGVRVHIKLITAPRGESFLLVQNKDYACPEVALHFLNGESVLPNGKDLYSFKKEPECFINVYLHHNGTLTTAHFDTEKKAKVNIQHLDSCNFLRTQRIPASLTTNQPLNRRTRHERTQ